MRERSDRVASAAARAAGEGGVEEGSARERAKGVRIALFGDLTGAVADLGVMVPLAAALILVCGLDPAAVFVGAGALVLGSGLYFRIPFPVQPLKALTAVAVARELGPGVINAAGLEIALFLAVLATTGAADRIARVFTKPVVRALQVGVGLLLAITATRLVIDPPAVFRGTPPAPWPVLGAVLAFIATWWAARTKHYVIGAAVVAAGTLAVCVSAPAGLSPPQLRLPSLAIPRPADFATAFLLIVVPQLPLTFGNAVVAVTDVAHRSFGTAAQRVSPTTVSVSCATGNVFAAVIGGMPMCHGAGGLTAHHRLGARSLHMNVGLGLAFLALGLFFARDVPAVLGSLPVWVLGAFLAYAGVRHTLLVSDLRGRDLIVACAAGALGAWRGNLALTVGIGLTYEAIKRAAPRRQAIA